MKKLMIFVLLFAAVFTGSMIADLVGGNSPNHGRNIFVAACAAAAWMYILRRGWLR